MWVDTDVFPDRRLGQEFNQLVHSLRTHVECFEQRNDVFISAGVPNNKLFDNRVVRVGDNNEEDNEMPNVFEVALAKRTKCAQKSVPLPPTPPHWVPSA